MAGGLRDLRAAELRLFQHFDACDTTDTSGVHNMVRKHKEFADLVDKAFSKRIVKEFPELQELGFEALASILLRGGADMEVPEIKEALSLCEDFALFGQFMRKRFEGLCTVNLQVFHDGENCWFGAKEDLKMDELILGTEAHIKEKADLPDCCTVHWRVYLGERTQANAKWHPCDKAVETLGTMGVEYIRVPCCKRDDVDVKLKDGLMRFARELRPLARQHLVVILSGDSDFSMNLKELKAEGFRTMLLHGGKLKPGVNADIVSPDWFRLLKRAGGGEAEPPSLPSSPHPARVPGSPTAAAEAAGPCKPPSSPASPSGPTPLNFPLELAGYIIGKKGKTVHAIQEASGASLKVDTTGGSCLVQVSGTDEAIRAAQEMLMEHVAKGPGMPEQECRRELSYSPRLAGQIIGRGGETAKGIARDTGAELLVDTPRSSGRSIVVVTGTQSQVRFCKTEVCSCHSRHIELGRCFTMNIVTTSTTMNMV